MLSVFAKVCVMYVSKHESLSVCDVCQSCLIK